MKTLESRFEMGRSSLGDGFSGVPSNDCFNVDVARYEASRSI
jgi:hypothetical protein